MALIPKSHLFIIFFTTIPWFSLSSSEPDPLTVYDILPLFGLPSGLLPDSVTNYTSSPDGQFSVSLAKPCYVQFDYYVYYHNIITGKLSYGSITDLDGIEVQRFFLWFALNEIKLDNATHSINFQVGFINQKLDIDQFMTIRSCY